MRFLSLDLETTGLNADRCQIIEIGAVYVSEAFSPKNWPRFSALIKREVYKGEPFALAMHQDRWYQLATGEEINESSNITEVSYKTLVMSESTALYTFKSWFERVHNSKRNCTLAGKNIGRFDCRFLERVKEFPLNRFHHRVLDPGNLYLLPSDDEIPSTQMCINRAGFKFAGSHKAMEDSEIVALLVQHKLGVTLNEDFYG